MFSLRVATEQDEDAVLAVFLKSPTYFRRVEGKEPDTDIVRNEMFGLPKKLSPVYRKEFLLVSDGDTDVGAIELHLHHPQEGIAYVGLFLLTEDMHGRGHGRALYHALEAHCRRQDIRSVRLGVSDDQDLSGFWRKLGFLPNGHSYVFQGQNRETRSIEYEKALTPPAS